MRAAAADGLNNQLSKKEHLLKIDRMLKKEQDTTVRVSLINSLAISTPEMRLIDKILEYTIKNDDCVTVRDQAIAVRRKLKR